MSDELSPVTNELTHRRQALSVPPYSSEPPPLARTLGDLLAEVILRGKSPQTRRAYRADLEDFLIWRLGQPIIIPGDLDELRVINAADPVLTAALRSLQAVSEADIMTYLKHLSELAGLAPATLNRRLTPLRLLFSRLHRYRLIAINPMEDVKGRRTSNVSATLWLSRQEARRLEDACQGMSLQDLRDRALIVLMLATGLRSSETLGLAVADFGEIDGHAVAWVHGKGGARERVKVPPRARRVVEGWLAAAELAEGPVFRRLYRLKEAPGGGTVPYRVHGPLSYAGLKFILKERFAAAGLAEQLSPHSLRHSFVTLALRGGAPLTKVQHAARHANPQTTMRYAHEQDALDDHAADYVRW